MFEVKRLEGWMTFRQIQESLGYKSSQGVYQLVFTSRVFDAKDVRHIETAQQPLYLVRESAVKAYKVLREGLAEQAQRDREASEAGLRLHADTVAARRRMRALLGGRGVAGRQARVDYVSGVLGREVDDWYGLGLADAGKVIASLTAE